MILVLAYKSPLNIPNFFHSMRRIRLKISAHDFLTRLQFNFLDVIIDLEILELFQYDQSNFLSLQKIHLKPGYMADLDNTMHKYFLAVWYQTMEQTQEEIVCILKQRADQGFWPVFMAGTWGLVPPIHVDQQYILLNVVTNESSDPDLLINMQSLADSVEVLSMERVDGDLASTSKSHSVPWSYFTPRQREIATYAARQGYFQMPKKIGTAQIGRHFQISAAAVSEHLRKIEQKLMHFVFG